MGKVTPRFRRQTYRKTYIRQWRHHANLTLEELADRIKTMSEGSFTTTHASLGRIERGLQPYSQALLEAIAEALRTDPGSLLMREPENADGIWSIWDQAKPAERQLIVDIAKMILKRNA